MDGCHNSLLCECNTTKSVEGSRAETCGQVYTPMAGTLVGGLVSNYILYFCMMKYQALRTIWLVQRVKFNLITLVRKLLNFEKTCLLTRVSCWTFKQKLRSNFVFSRLSEVCGVCDVTSMLRSNCLQSKVLADQGCLAHRLKMMHADDNAYPSINHQ
jgi:hypothetical protein